MAEIDFEKVAKNLVLKIGEGRKNLFLMQWKGTKIPHGATIGGIEIGWTQHGIITGKGGEQLGEYYRFEEKEFDAFRNLFNQGENQMIAVMTDYDDVTSPQGVKLKSHSQPKIINEELNKEI
jgi:hypothetical protein